MTNGSFILTFDGNVSGNKQVNFQNPWPKRACNDDLAVIAIIEDNLRLNVETITVKKVL